MASEPKKLKSNVPDLRVRVVNEAVVSSDGEYVLYWMIANRRVDSNFSFERAVDWAVELKKPLLVLEALRCGYRWASDRIHHFVIQGMADNQQRLVDTPVGYYPYLEKNAGEGRGLLAALAEKASVVVSDDFPCFFLPKMLASANRQIGCRFELVDSNGLLPMRAAPKVFSRAYDFRRYLQKNLLPHLNEMPQSNPLARRKLKPLQKIPAQCLKTWPAADVARLANEPEWLKVLPIDHGVCVAPFNGGTVAAGKQIRSFVKSKLKDYLERNQPERDVASGLSPYLHFGHASAHAVFQATAKEEGWSSGAVAEKATGSSRGWWGASEPFESFADELITWRELGYNMCWQRPDYDQYESLPEWAQKTLEEHTKDKREHVYDLEEFEYSRTHDPLWNAAQRQLVQDGRMHNYLRMLWGKKILQWTNHPQDALEIMIELNNKYAVDGRNPNSYSGIFWVLGRYDRAWGPERPIFGKIRYMTSENTARKVRVKDYLRQYGRQAELFE